MTSIDFGRSSLSIVCFPIPLNTKKSKKNTWIFADEKETSRKENIFFIMIADYFMQKSWKQNRFMIVKGNLDVNRFESAERNFDRCLDFWFSTDTSGFNLCVDVNQLTIIYRSTDDSVVRGKVRLQTEINYNGIGNLDAFQLLSRSIKLDANGLGTVMVTGIEQCFIEARALAVVQQRCFKERKFTRKDLAKIINRP